MRDSTKREGCYIILLQSIGKMLRSLSTDIIFGEVQYGKCLCERMNERLDKKVGILHCFVVEHCQDVALLVHRSDWRRGSVW
jgi:hypothetical protein